MGKDFDVANVRDALSAFSRLISPAHKKLFDNIFDTLQTGLSKLGDSAASQTKAIRDLLHLIKDIPMDGRQDYDVLGFIYEYLIGMFAANAGKKAGEFYTPHEVSILISEIIAHHVRDKKEIQIYDPTSGSGSLLINIGSSVAKHIDDENNIKYYAQELKENTYNLTRMNLVMRGLLPNNIITRNGDTLEDDWPYFDENDPIHTYNPLYVDAVVSNPPYSQKWDPAHKEADPRYSRFGLAPKSKADYAFLLHDLYHLKPDGIMAIVLPHGVLFRSGEESVIREKLIEENHIDIIIGLPPNIFFGTKIPTTIIVLRQKRKNSDVLFIDASKSFVKVNKNNKLRSSDIKKIVDTVENRDSIPKYARLVSKQEIRDNQYKLNISRYVNSTDEPEKWDVYASMYGGIPENEIDELQEYWNAFSGLRNTLFKQNSPINSNLIVDNINTAIDGHQAVQAFVKAFSTAFAGFDSYLKTELLSNMLTVKINREKTVLIENIFTRLSKIPLIDKYEAYQLLDDEWEIIKIDLEIIQTEGFDASIKVDPNMVTRKKDGTEQEVQEGWVGRVMPFLLVQETYLKEDLNNLRIKENRVLEIATELVEIIGSLSEEEIESNVLNEENDGFLVKELNEYIKDIYADVETEEIKALKDYLNLLEGRARKPEKEDFIKTHKQVNWAKMEANNDGTFSKGTISKYLFELQLNFTFPEESFESKMVKASLLLALEKELKTQIKAESAALHLKTKETIENLTDEQVYELLELKWIKPILHSIYSLPESVIDTLSNKTQLLAVKYNNTYTDISLEIDKTESTLSSMIEDLKGSELDIMALNKLKLLLHG
jgi:type I restriction enzyme M protein